MLAMSSLLVAACEKASDDEAKAERAQAVAADKLTAATVEANQKIAAAQTEADKKVAEAQASFQRLRENYRHDLMLTLASLDERISNLNASERTTSGQARSELDAKLARVRATRDRVTVDYQTLEAASAATWDVARTELDKDVNALSAEVNEL
jgi:hypothetical protein